jgi:long-chain acyl-CoA synthetase
LIRLSFETSGTTGEPKTVTHSLDAMMANAAAFNEAVGLGPETRMYHCLPTTHMAGFLNTVLCPTLAGGTVVWGQTFSAHTAAGFWLGVNETCANAVWVTPTIVAMLLRLNRVGRGISRSLASGLEHVFCGTAPLHLTLRQQWLEAFGVPLQESYGTSEHMLVSVQSKEDALTEYNVGRLLPGVTVEFSASCEILVNGSPTGDQGGRLGGKLTITGRLKDLIIRGGFNVSPAQIEEVVRSAPDAVDAAAVGEKDDFWGEKIVVFAESNQKYAKLAQAQIVAHCRMNLPQSHWPDRIEIVDKLPRNEMGKVRKGELLSMLAE